MLSSFQAQHHWSNVRSLFRSIRLRLLGISPSATSFEKRGFRGEGSGARERIEKIGQSFVAGYHAALAAGDPDALGEPLDAFELEQRGFAYEGAAMALALLDRLTPWRRDRVSRFLVSSGEPHTYMVHVGVGWAAARLPGRIDALIRSYDPVLRWLILDGYGFHEGFFHWQRCLAPGAGYPKRVSGYSRRAFDQGLGRSLWFIEGSDVSRIRETISSFSGPRQSDLWSGLGLAAVYAGQVCETDLRRLRDVAGPFCPQLAQGAAFAAKARARAGNMSTYTQLACSVLCGTSAADAAAVTDAALENLPDNQSEPAYEVWRRRIQHRFSQRQEMKP